MREIKFRFWCVNRVLKMAFMEKPMTLKEIANYASKPENEDLGHRIYEESTNGNSFVIEMQYTGFKDKNEKDIYESDILKMGEYAFEVYMTDDNYWCLKPLSEGAIMTDMTRKMLENNSVVIGNFYENNDLYELLEKSK